MAENDAPPDLARELNLIDNHELEKLLKIDRSTVWVLRKRPHDRLPCYKIGGRVLFKYDEILSWVARQKEQQAPAPRPRGRPRKCTAGVR